MRFLKNALAALNRIYKFESGTVSVDQVDLSSPIQLVHDTSREAELAAIVTGEGAGGYFAVGQDNVHAGADTIEATVNPYASLDASWGIPNDRWIWLMKASGQASAFATSDVAILTVGVGALGNALARRDFPIVQYNSSVTMTTDLSATFPQGLVRLQSTASGAGLFQDSPLPFPIFPGSVITWRTARAAAGAATIRFSSLCWIGPIGVFPPGVR